LLGCIPEHNRDPQLLRRIKHGEVLRLCNGGGVEFNYVHPNDIATAIKMMVGNSKTFGQSYNLVNPSVIKARDYYEQIAKVIGGKLNIENVSMAQIWQEMKGWEMTTLPHIYSMNKMKEDIGYLPDTSLEQAIQDAIQNQPVLSLPLEQFPIHKRMNKLPRPNKINWLLT
jgi:nucleoside-diphosphate-sugar epimerase